VTRKKKPKKASPDGELKVKLSAGELLRMTTASQHLPQYYEQAEAAQKRLDAVRSEANRVMLEILKAHKVKPEECERGWVIVGEGDHEAFLVPVPEGE
jgi:hypothetical protein